jgi:hypothetical protein
MSKVKSKQEQWEKLVASGGADDFFSTYDDDLELAGKLNGFFKGDGEVSAEAIERDRDRFHKLPRRGELRTTQMASPTKFVILNKARQLNANEALAEILDNIFDNFERNVKGKRTLEISITAYAPTGSTFAELIVKENSGGIPEERIGPLVQLGASDRSTAGIGAWGEGFKMAAFALGEEIEVFSSFKGEDPIAIHFPKNWLEPQNKALWTQWKVDIFGVDSNPPPVGSTVIRVTHLHSQVIESLGLKNNSIADTDPVCDALASYFGEVYSEKYHRLVAKGHTIKIDLNIGASSRRIKFFRTVEDRLRDNLAFLPWMRPIKWERVFETTLKEDDNRIARLEMTIYAGLAVFDAYSPTYADDLSNPGVEMWGNGRKFSLKGRITDESVGWGVSFAGPGGNNPSSNSSYRRLTLVVLFSSEDSRDIPWAAPVKNDYNRRSHFYSEIQSTLAWVIRLFKNVHNLLEFVQTIFSTEWSKLSASGKLELLFDDVDPDEKAIRRFGKSRFAKKLFRFDPNLDFKQVSEGEKEPTIHYLYDVLPTNVTDIVKAAQATKQSVEQRIEFLKAIFPGLARQAQLEDAMDLAEDEVIGL